MVEHLLAKEGVEGSNPFFRSNSNSDNPAYEPVELEQSMVIFREVKWCGQAF